LQERPHLSRLNMGGGFPVPYTDEEYPPVESFAQALTDLLAGRKIHLSLEPGRYIVADAGALIIEVQYVKQVGETRFLVADGGMTELIRPALYGATHPIQPLRLSINGSITPAQVVGPICESSDVLRSDAPLPPIVPGDRLAVMMAGAYGAVMASTYNARPRAPEIIVDGAAWQIARRRETWDDLIALER
jgi:diaminopimelate decarboxylase